MRMKLLPYFYATQDTSLRLSDIHENLSEFRIGGGADDDSVSEGSFKVTTGVPHGAFRKINEFGDVEFFGLFYEGNLVARCWKSLPGGTYAFVLCLETANI